MLLEADMHMAHVMRTALSSTHLTEASGWRRCSCSCAPARCSTCSWRTWSRRGPCRHHRYLQHGDILVRLIIVTCSGNFLSHQPFTSIHYYFSNYKSLETILLTFALKINNHDEPFFMYNDCNFDYKNLSTNIYCILCLFNIEPCKCIDLRNQ